MAVYTRKLLAILVVLSSRVLSFQIPTHQRQGIVTSRLFSQTSALDDTVVTKDKKEFLTGDLDDFWDWKNDWKIHFVRKSSSVGQDKNINILFLPGFGVGTFHFDRNLPDLADQGHTTWAIDLLGQGQSWPQTDESEEGLTYSVDMWTDQIIDFIDEVIQSPVNLCGNSLGGLIGTIVAAKRPDLVQSLTLLNATPFWAFLPVKGSVPGWVEKLLPWDGELPAPGPLYKFGSFYFDNLRSSKTVKSMLGLVYHSKENLSDDLVENIIAATNSGRGHAAFTSILFARKPSISFEEALSSLKCPVCLMYGKNDPWVTPFWGHKVKSMLKSQSTYFEISSAGHCPHHEAPTVVNNLIDNFVVQVKERGAEALLEWPEAQSLQGVTVEGLSGVEMSVEVVDEKPRSFMEFATDKFGPN